MKKFLPFLVAIAVIATMVVLSAQAYAEKKTWILYDNFNTSYIDPDRWIIRPSSAIISVEGGKAKFEHLAGYPNVPAYLYIKISPETVRGIKAKVTVQSCTGDVRARITGYIGKVDDDYVFDQLVLEGSNPRPVIFGSLAVLDPSGAVYLYDLFYANFIRPLVIIGNTFALTMTFSEKKVTYEVDDLGEIEYQLPEDLSPTDLVFKGIGTRSTNGDGPCVVYFDDVYVLR